MLVPHQLRVNVPVMTPVQDERQSLSGNLELVQKLKDAVSGQPLRFEDVYEQVPQKAELLDVEPPQLNRPKKFNRRLAEYMKVASPSTRPST